MNSRITGYSRTRSNPSKAISMGRSRWLIYVVSISIALLGSTLLAMWRWNSNYREQVKYLQSDIALVHMEKMKTQQELNDSKLENEGIRNKFQSLASKHLNRLLDFAGFVKDDPRLAKRVLIEAGEFASQQSIDKSVIAETLTTVPTPKQLASDCSVNLLDVSNATNAAQILVEVKNADGSFVHDLSRVDFDLKSRGKTVHPVRVCEESTSRGSHWISILLDSSSSISPQEFTSVQQAAKGLVRSIANPWRLRIVRFASDVKPISPWTYDPQIHENAIDRIMVEGATALNEAIRSEVSELLPLVGMRSLVIFTDGNDSSNAIDLEPVFQRCRTEGISIHVVALSRGTINEVVLRSMASQTHGSYHSIASVDRLQTTFGNIAQSLRTPVYRVTALAPIDMQNLQLSVGGIVASKTDSYLTVTSSVITKPAR